MQSIYERFFEKIDKTDECWNWLGFVNSKGYGKFSNKITSTMAHRFSYVIYKGEVPQKYTIDHLCRNRRCVNPNHLEAVPHQINCQRGKVGKHAGQIVYWQNRELCKNNLHLRTPDNLVKKGKDLCCKECVKLSRQREKLAKINKKKIS